MSGFLQIEQGFVLHSVISFAGPAHGLPPNCGGGFVQVRFRNCVPPPHVTVQDIHAPQSEYLPSTGQLFVLQFSDCSDSLEHSFPPNCGGGFVQVRFRSCVPPPQVTEHEVHAPQSEYLPSMGHSGVLHSRKSCRWPSHSVPPYNGTGFVHDLFLPCTPPPQVSEHCDHSLQKLKPPLIGHGVRLQSDDSWNSPVQFFPPNAGKGLLHCLNRFLLPPPQLCEQ